MKKIFLLLLPTIFLLASCTKTYVEPVSPIDENYWLQQERGTVVYSDNVCPYFVVKTYNGYAVLRSLEANNPYVNTVMFGDFSNYGGRTFYNYSGVYLEAAEVAEYWISYYDAMDAIDYYCQNGFKGASNYKKAAAKTK